MSEAPMAETGNPGRLSASGRAPLPPGRRGAGNPARAPSFAVWPGQSVALVAPSGAGKSTLLHIAGLLEHPDGGEVYHRRRADLGPVGRRAHADPPQLEIGFVYQSHHLLPEFSALENVMLPQMIRGLSRGEARKRARASC